MATITVKRNEDLVVVATNGFDSVGQGTPELYTKSGWLTGQALALGYVEWAEGVTLSANEGVFGVKGEGAWFLTHDFNEARKEFVRRVKAKLFTELRALAGMKEF